MSCCRKLLLSFVLGFLAVLPGTARTVNWLMRDLNVASENAVEKYNGMYVNPGFSRELSDGYSATVDKKFIVDIEESFGLYDQVNSWFEISSGSSWLSMTTSDDGVFKHANVTASSNEGGVARYGIVKLHKVYNVDGGTQEHVFWFPVGQCGDEETIGTIYANYSILLLPWDGDVDGSGVGYVVTGLTNVDSDSALSSRSDDSSMIWEKFDYANSKHYHYYARNNSGDVKCIKTTITSSKYSGSIRIWNFFAPRPPETLAACANFNATDDEVEKVVCTWSAVTGATLYKVFRAGVLIGSTASCTFTDTEMELNTRYTYSVIPVKQESGSDIATGPESSDSGLALSPDPDLVSISISGASSVKALQSAKYACTATYDDGSTLTVSPSWTLSSGSQYATISSSGVLTAKSVSSQQSVTIRASYTDNGITRIATKTVTIIPVLLGPDLVVSGSFSPTTITRTQKTSISLTVRNTGDSTAAASTVWIQIGSAVWLRSIPSLAAGASSSISGLTVSGSTFSVGSYTVKLTADGNRVVSESNENNNVATLGTLTVVTDATSSIDFQFKKRQTSDPAVAWLSTSLTSKKAVTSFTQGDAIYVQCGYWNAKGKAVSGTITVQAMLRKKFSGQFTVCNSYEWYWSGLGKNVVGYILDKYRNPSTIQNLPVGEYKLTLKLDSKDAYSESNESNNEYDILFSVVAKAPQTYTVVFHYNSGSGDKTASRTFTVGAEQSLPWVNSGLGWANPSGTAFSGWAESSSGAVKYLNGAKVKNLASANGTKHLYAKWKSIVTVSTYKVRYHYNYGTTDRTIDQSFTYGTEQRLTYLDSGLKWAHPLSASFLGWSTSADGDVKYANGAKVKNLTSTNNGVIHLYAKWSLITVVYHRNAGVASEVKRQWLVPNVAQSLLWLNSQLGWKNPTGKALVGWSTSSNATIAQYANGARVSNLATAGKTVHLYAVWGAGTRSYTIRYCRNYTSSDATCAYQLRSLDGMSCLAWKDSQLGWATPSGKTFLGWSMTRSAKVATYTNGLKIPAIAANGATVALYAIWK